MCLYVCVYVHKNMSKCLCACASMRAHTCIYNHTHQNTYTCMESCICKFVYVCMHYIHKSAYMQNQDILTHTTMYLQNQHTRTHTTTCRHMVPSCRWREAAYVCMHYIHKSADTQVHTHTHITTHRYIVPKLPWTEEAHPDEGLEYCEPPDAGELPATALQLDYVYTYSGQRCRNNLHALHTGELLYSSGGVGVVHDVVKGKQRLYTAHDDSITCMCMHPLLTSDVIASGQGGDNPRVCVWNSRTTQTLLVLQTQNQTQIQNYNHNIGGKQHGTNGQHATYTDDDYASSYPRHQPPRVYTSLAGGSLRNVCFSHDGSLLVAVSCDGISVYERSGTPQEHPWSDVRHVDTLRRDMCKTLCAGFNSLSGVLVTCGVRSITFWEVVGGAKHAQSRGRQSGSDMYSSQITSLAPREGTFGCEREDETFTSLAFIGQDTTLTGGKSGLIWIWKGVRAARVIADAHVGPVLDMYCDGMTVVSGGADAKICVWNLNRDFRAAPPGAIERGEMLVRQFDLLVELKRGAEANPNLSWMTEVAGCKEVCERVCCDVRMCQVRRATICEAGKQTHTYIHTYRI
jgi:WD40 repeat protein